jgi:hypothetical protein
LHNTGGTFNVSALTDIFVSGGTYSTGTATFNNSTGGTFNVAGFYTGATDVFVTSGTLITQPKLIVLQIILVERLMCQH